MSQLVVKPVELSLYFFRIASTPYTLLDNTRRSLPKLWVVIIDSLPVIRTLTG